MFVIITAGFNTKIVDPDDGLHSSRLQAQYANQTSPIVENQWSTAAATFGAGAMKHKE